MMVNYLSMLGKPIFMFLKYITNNLYFLLYIPECVIDSYMRTYIGMMYVI